MIDVDFLKSSFIEMAELLEFILNIESGMITISMTEYQSFPRVMLHTWNIYKNELAKKRQHERAQMVNQYGT